MYVELVILLFSMYDLDVFLMNTTCGKFPVTDYALVVFFSLMYIIYMGPQLTTL